VTERKMQLLLGVLRGQQRALETMERNVDMAEFQRVRVRRELKGSADQLRWLQGRRALP
jgi:hypothetical protein